jgi:hypothetical protein
MLRSRAIQLQKGKDSGMTLKGKRIEILELHSSPIQPHAEDTSANHAPNHDEIRHRAYEVYLERGGLSGGELDDWLQADSELRSGVLFLRTTTEAKQGA